MAYCTVADVKQYLGNTTTDDDTLLGELIPRAQKAIETHTHRVFEATSDTTRVFDADCDTDDRLLYLDEDIVSITTVTNGDGTTVTSSQYVTYPRNRTPYYAVELKLSPGIIWEYDSSSDPEGAISVTGKWAYSESPPDDIVHACIRLVGYYYRQKDSQVYDTTATPELGTITVPMGLPKDVKTIVRPYVKVV